MPPWDQVAAWEPLETVLGNLLMECTQGTFLVDSFPLALLVDKSTLDTAVKGIN